MADITTVPDLEFLALKDSNGNDIVTAASSAVGGTALEFASDITDQDGSAITKAVCLGFKVGGKRLTVYIAAGGFSDERNCTITTRPIETSGIDLTTAADSALDVEIPAGTKVYCVIPPQHPEIIFQALLGNISHSVKFAANPTFDAGVSLVPNTYATVAARNAAIPAPDDWEIAGVDDTGFTWYNPTTAQWETAGSETPTPNASTTAAGKVEEATQAENNAGTATGDTGASLAATPAINAVSVQNSVWTYAADAEASDTYAITLAPAPTAYAAGQRFVFKANTANTGAATLNVNALGAKTLKKLNDQDLEDGDIEAGQIVDVIYDGTNLQVQTPAATAITSAQASTLTGGAASDADALHTHDGLGLQDAGFESETDAGTTGTTNLDTTITVGYQPSIIEIEYQTEGRNAAQKYSSGKAVFDGTTGKYQLSWFAQGSSSEAMTTANPVTGFTSSSTAAGAATTDNCLTTFLGVLSVSATGFVLRTSVQHGGGGTSTGYVRYGWKCWK